MLFKRSVDSRLPFELSWVCHEVGTNRSFMFAWTHWTLAETFIQDFKASFYGVAFKFRGRLLWGQLPIIGLLPGQSASQCTIGSMLSRDEKKPRHERYGTESSTVKDDLNFARRGKESTYISVSIWNTLLFPPTSDLIYRMKWQTDVCIPNTGSPTILKTSFSSWIVKTFVYFAAQHMADYLKILILY